ncbi:hypothetical protein J7T55_011449 [Diaporthe amygdali]|uniref:uncharacterized protein n=1 Tax=Phomopsis amygdali TaxID=1214568 RepID=UPI0022FE1C93|nr:uncharacterized protein J7T55_011449 [Diaporthe amygdali]KAJ0122988.1 hypothetical protein J7T55_011449 [Diaporthe amygdali]
MGTQAQTTFSIPPSLALFQALQICICYFLLGPVELLLDSPISRHAFAIKVARPWSIAKPRSVLQFTIQIPVAPSLLFQRLAIAPTPSQRPE